MRRFFLGGSLVSPLPSPDGAGRQGPRSDATAADKTESLGNIIKAAVGDAVRSTDSFTVRQVNPQSLKLEPVPTSLLPVPRLEYGLDRALFNPGVYLLQDTRSKVYNFDPYLATIMPIQQFDFNALKRYITSSKDTTLTAMAAKHRKKYCGSTSSMTAPSRSAIAASWSAESWARAP